MRKQFVKTLQEILYKDETSVLLLGDIGVFGFRNELKNLSDRIYNIGILEQATVSVAAGLAKSGMNTFVHTIAPFIVERALEQLKIDFGYQNLNGNFISVGASYDYASLGCTHHCPGDIIALSSIPNMELVVPGNSEEFDALLKQSYNNKKPTYFRLSEYENTKTFNKEFGKAVLVKKGKLATVVCYGNLLDNVLKATENLDVSVLYYNTIFPFDKETLLENFNKNIIICEPFYEGSTNYFINKSLKEKHYKLENIGIPREFLKNYGKKEEHDDYLKLNVAGIQQRILECIQ
jgi:transketolase